MTKIIPGLEWAIYYDDDSVITNLTCDVAHVPFWGVQVIVYRDNERGWFTQTSCKYYCWDDRGDGWRWYGADDVGMLDYMSRPGMKRFIVGRTIPNKRFSEIHNRAMREFGKKASHYRWERRVENG